MQGRVTTEVLWGNPELDLLFSPLLKWAASVCWGLLTSTLVPNWVNLDKFW
jgi:hypothetical protein